MDACVWHLYLVSIHEASTTYGFSVGNHDVLQPTWPFSLLLQSFSSFFVASRCGNPKFSGIM